LEEEGPQQYALVLTSLVDHSFLLLVIASLRDQGCLVFSLTLFRGNVATLVFFTVYLPQYCTIRSPRVLLLMQDGSLENTWLMDSDCSRHMTGRSNGSLASTS
jgi:hypothetical protein